VSTLTPDLPAEMYANGRGVDPQFQQDELLYCRLVQDYPIGSHPEGVSLSWPRLPEFSANRSKYSPPEYVLLPEWVHWGIVEFYCCDVPAPITSPGRVTFNWCVHHVPLEDNYAHSEVRTFRGTERYTGKLHELVKKGFRQAIAERMVVLKRSSVC
jgi:hypothetical protein